MNVRRSLLLAAPLLLCMLAICQAQEETPIGVPLPPLGDGPWVIDTAEQHKIRVSVLARELAHPWAIAFLPDGGMLITERDGRLRVVRDDKLDPHPIPGVPEMRTDGNGGLMDVALHPGFATTASSISPIPGRPATAAVHRRSRGAASKGAHSSTSRTCWSPRRTRATRGSTGGSPSAVTARSTCPPAAGSPTSRRSPTACAARSCA